MELGRVANGTSFQQKHHSMRNTLMHFQYESTLDDIAEPHIRLFARSSTYKRNRYYWFFSATLGAAASLLLIKHYFEPMFPYWVAFLGSFLCGIGCYFVYPDTVKKQIKNHLKREINQYKPIITTYTITDKNVECTSSNIKIPFEIKDLLHITEDNNRIELSFGPKGICVIPKRVFPTQDEINHFKNLFDKNAT